MVDTTLKANAAYSKAPALNSLSAIVLGIALVGLIAAPFMVLSDLPHEDAVLCAVCLRIQSSSGLYRHSLLRPCGFLRGGRPT
ncbi:hypothetical protein H721_03025 [Brucella ovis IntaBari-2006-46-332]|nr:hypothetical protein C010_03192 [Brucella ovis 80/125]ENR05563.1 hypothetical protein C961_02893 [Brucella ovis F8/05B]ENS92572.1 hypothetical protein B999_03161 [Brucella ovis 63/96]ENS96082.1 hypothetical protein C009_03040 [Brucella ovis 81/8]ENT75865.1 hypothetical protein H712_03170 [Brucella ovis IntaBari-2009-88-4]ENT77295.1 hypothetical protein H720_02957 [Brucella ovis IntaBari-2006-46-348]ENT81317.1 hypothetical protein H713_03178 [Brucella ovis IntaBari-2010-47-268]ENT85486.1 h